MALDIVQVEGCYVSSSLPKALFVPSPSVRFRRRENVNPLYFKPKKKEFKIRPLTIGTDEKECLPVEGRQHLSVQTDLYLEEICDIVEEADAQTETEHILNRPPSPLFIPTKSGPDVSTQIYPGELFDFDEEVEPLIEALVGQTLEQAIIEVMAEEESAVLPDLQTEFETKQNAELAELKHLEEERTLEEKQRRLKEQEESIKLEDEIAQKIVACIFSQNYLAELVPQVYKKLEGEGYFETEDPELNDVEDNFWPWLLNEVDSEIATLEASCQLLDNLIEDSAQSVAENSIIESAVSNIYSHEQRDASAEGQDTADSTKLDKDQETSNLEQL